jgi:hypothetical protein
MDENYTYERVYSGSGPTSWDMEETYEFIKKYFEKIPEEFRSHATCEVECSCDSGDELRWRISYRRPETDEEVNARKARDAVYLKKREDLDRETYERLKAKFEG